MCPKRLPQADCRRRLALAKWRWADARDNHCEPRTSPSNFSSGVRLLTRLYISRLHRPHAPYRPLGPPLRFSRAESLTCTSGLCHQPQEAPWLAEADPQVSALHSPLPAWSHTNRTLLEQGQGLQQWYRYAQVVPEEAEGSISKCAQANACQLPPASISPCMQCNLISTHRLRD